MSTNCTELHRDDESHDYIQVGPIEFIKDLPDGKYMGKHIEQCTKCGRKREITGFYGGKDDLVSHP